MQLHPHRPGKRTLAELARVRPDIKCVSLLAMRLSQVDFSVYAGVRTLEEQKQMVVQGKSRHSDPERAAHVEGRAVDVVAVGVPNEWSSVHYFRIAMGFRESSVILDTPIRWGGIWALELAKLDVDSPTELLAEYNRYVAKFEHQRGRKPLADFVHFEVFG